MEETIKFCPVCGNDAPDEIVQTTGSDWHCQSCDKVIDAYILSKDFLDKDNELDFHVSETEKEVLIHFCPVCRFESTKPIDVGQVFDHGGAWICEQCDEYVEAFVLPNYHKDTYQENTENKRTPYSFMPILIILLILLIALFWFLIK